MGGNSATANVLNIGNVNAPVSADIEVCLCVGADAELGESEQYGMSASAFNPDAIGAHRISHITS